MAATKLSGEFGVDVNVEDLFYNFQTTSRVASEEMRLYGPKWRLLETHLNMRPDGRLLDLRQALVDLVDMADAQQLSFLYRVDSADMFALVATGVRGEGGRQIDMTPLLDRRITIPLGTRRAIEHVNLLTRALEAQTGIQVGCCQAGVAGVPFGFWTVSFEAHDEPARAAFVRLLRTTPGAPVRYRWSMMCDFRRPFCFINLASHSG